MQGRRIDRIEEQLRIELGQILEREINDPRVGLATVTNVKVSADLSHARVYFTVLGNADDRKRALEGLRSASGFARRELGKRLHHMRRIPDLTFEYDESVEKDIRLQELLNQLKPDSE
ncbi:MAG TPA: 30S ribosome-binding factor RbfA [Terriglobia bacterium]|nr:30S ribosome-binding factor RbfA [Terriglobia bacterium]